MTSFCRSPGFVAHLATALTLRCGSGHQGGVGLGVFLVKRKNGVHLGLLW